MQTDLRTDRLQQRLPWRRWAGRRRSRLQPSAV